jgi:hypothetical protein
MVVRNDRLAEPAVIGSLQVEFEPDKSDQIQQKLSEGKMAPAPSKVLMSYSHDSPVHAKCVLELADRLRADGIDWRVALVGDMPPLTHSQDGFRVFPDRAEATRILTRPSLVRVAASEGRFVPGQDYEPVSVPRPGDRRSTR